MIPGINFTYCRHFIRHYLSATRIDVLHSPFVFALYNECIRRQPKLDDFVSIEALRKQLKSDYSVVTQKDYGAGSSLFSGKKRSIRELVLLHAKQPRLQQILFHLIRKMHAVNLVELGTSLGLTTAYLAKSAAPDGKVVSIEGADEIAEIARMNMQKLRLLNTVILNGLFDQILPHVLEEMKRVDFAYIDGNHQYQPTLDYFNQILPYTHNNSVIIFDDIYWSSGMAKAWGEIKEHPQVSVTVDLFFMGLVFFRREQAKEHFRLRVF